VTTDLDGFRLIVPCGLSAHAVASLASLVGASPPIEDVARASLVPFAEVFEAEATMASTAASRELMAA
jgi:lipoate-protein ligase B